jgi:hypothetical protein
VQSVLWTVPFLIALFMPAAIAGASKVLRVRGFFALLGIASLAVVVMYFLVACFIGWLRPKWPSEGVTEAVNEAFWRESRQGSVYVFVLSAVTLISSIATYIFSLKRVDSASGGDRFGGMLVILTLAILGSLALLFIADVLAGNG